LGIVFFGLGSVPLQLASRVSLSTRLGVAGLIGLTTAMLIGAAMVLLPLWYPDLAAILVLAAACTIHALALPSAFAGLRLWVAERRHRRIASCECGAQFESGSEQELFEAAQQHVAHHHPDLGGALELDVLLHMAEDVGGREWARAELRRIASSPSLLCTLVGTALWLGSAILSPRIVPGIGGFLPHITPLWYVGVVLVLAAIALARRERHEAYAAIAVVALALAFTLTPALLYGMPRSQSAAKHIELVRFILRTHHLHVSAGIYAAYSAFFSAVAWLCRVARVSDPTGLATFWPTLMVLIEVAGLRFMFGQILDGRYRRWAAVTLVLLVNAIGAEYFSPQSVGFVMGIGIYGLALGERSEIDRRLATAVLLPASCALAIAHELSPYIIGGVLLVLGAFRCSRLRWAGVPILSAAAAWALVNYHVLKGYFSFSSLGSLSNFAPPSTPTAPGLSRGSIVAVSSDALALGLLVLTAAALVGFARYRRTRAAWTYIISAGVGLMFVAVNSYGNEGIFRAALFGIPWLALMAMRSWRAPGPRLGSIAWIALSVGLLATFLVASFAMDGTAVMRSADLQALRFFERNAPPGNYLLNAGFGDLPSIPPSSPSSTEISYYKINDRAWQRPDRPHASDLDELLARYEHAAGGAAAAQTGRLYAIWSPVLSLYAQEYGLGRPSQSTRWLDLLFASPSWQVAYADAGTFLFRAGPPPTTAATR
jgi:hypothetical protein